MPFTQRSDASETIVIEQIQWLSQQRLDAEAQVLSPILLLPNRFASLLFGTDGLPRLRLPANRIREATLLEQ